MFFDRFFGFGIPACGIFACLLFTLSVSDVTFAQGNVNSTGNGGKHVIQGSIYVGSGRRASINGMKVILESAGLGDMSVIADDNGSFGFRNLVPGSYTVRIDGTDNFEPVQESVNIDDPGSSSMAGVVRMLSTPRIINLHFFLKPKRNVALLNQVINAKWSMVPKPAIHHYERGVDLSQQGRDDEALKEFRESSMAYPGFSLPYIEAGKIYIRTGRIDEAVAILSVASQLDASDFEARLNFGIALLDKREFSEAQRELIRAGELQPAAVTPHFYLGKTYLYKDELDKAQAEFEAAKRLLGTGDLPPLHRYLGGIYWKKAKAVSDETERQDLYRQAVEELEKYVKLVPAASDAKQIRTTIKELRSKLG
jgi:hypothetical protein